MEIKDESNLDQNTRYRKFGLPNWMVNNIERLNFVTDFEQYACSPPETEGFLSEHLDNCGYHNPSEPYCPVGKFILLMKFINFDLLSFIPVVLRCI